jgi:hypothetical protein
MRNLRHAAKEFRARVLLAVAAILVCISPAAFAAKNITGSVHNATRGEPAAGDEVLLFSLDGGTQEEARAKTGARGEFTLALQYPEMPHLLRVLHDGVSYDQRASSGDALSIEVFDAASRVRGITGTVEILRTGTNGNLLHVSDMIEIKNSSSPRLTQAGERTFEIVLPSNAKLDSVLAAGPGKTGELISATSVPGEPGHFTVNFPLRPGATEFAFNYDLPYDGRVTFHPKLAFPMEQLAVMIPPTMKFSSRSQVFELLATGNSRYHAWAVNQVKAGEGLEFEISGTGALPPLGDHDKGPAQSQATPHLTTGLTASAHAKPPAALPMDATSKPAQPSSQALVLGALTSMLLAACTLLLWHGRKARKYSATQWVAPRTRSQKQRSAA